MTTSGSCFVQSNGFYVSIYDYYYVSWDKQNKKWDLFSCGVIAIITNSWFQRRSYVTCSGFRLHSGWSLVCILYNIARYPSRLCSICACAVQWVNLSIKHTCMLYPHALVTLWVSYYKKNWTGKSWRPPQNEHQPPVAWNTTPGML